MSQSVARDAVLAYHEVMPESTYSYCVTLHRFADHLRFFKSLSQCGSPKCPVEITFDDGEQSQYHNALPLLDEYGIRATFFVSPGVIGTAAKFLGWDELRAMQAGGHYIQSHGWSHKFLTNCGDAELVHELVASKQFLEDNLGATVEEISVPGGRWNQHVIEACAVAGYKRVYVSQPWVAENMFGIELVGRFMVRRTTNITELQKIVQKDQHALQKLKTRAQIRQRLVGLLGEGLYHRLWCRLTGYNEFEAVRRQDFHC